MTTRYSFGWSRPLCHRCRIGQWSRTETSESPSQVQTHKPSMRIPLLIAVIALQLPSMTEADVRLPRLFRDNMVLQQKSKNAIWGWAEPGEEVKVSASWGAVASAVADDSGRWKLFLHTPDYGTGHSLVVAAQNSLRINNVATGEVWLCAGQSNMGWAMGNSFEADEESDVDLPDFRIFKSQREHWHEPLAESRDRLQQWKPCNPQSAAETSAVSYWFGKTLHQKLGVPVGIIVQAYAGTPIEGWMPWEIQKNDARAVEHKQSLDVNAQRRIARGETIEKALATFQKELVGYNEKIDAGETMKNAFRPLQPPFITKPASLGHQYPAHIFNAMIHPVRPYGIRGMIWYQGERNSKNVPQAAHYREQLAKLIGYYRSSWHELSDGNVSAEFPVQFTQLPGWNPAQTEPVEGLEASWAVNRESMRLVEQDLAATGMVVSIDTGDAVELHPKNKKPIGIRHALLALQQTYARNVVGRGPQFRGHRVRGGQITLDFDSTGSGLMTARPESLDAFAIAGKDRKWHWAEARIDGPGVVVSSDEVPQPVAVRYAWAMNPSQRNLLYNKEGLPASPFRTDTWPLFAPGDEIIDVNKPEKPDGYQAVDWTRPTMLQATDAPLPVVLARRGPLIVDDDGSENRGGKTPLSFDHGVKLRAAAGNWERIVPASNVWRSTWKPGMGHTPVASYHGIEATNLIVEVTFRYGEMSEPWHHQCFRIAADQRPTVTGHIVSAWANPNNDFIETGFLLQHIRKTPEKKIVEDLLLDRQPLVIEPKTWYTATLEIVGDEALFRMGDHVAYAKAEQIRTPKNLVSFTLGTTWHEIKRVRIWNAEPNPEWSAKKDDILRRRKPFTPVKHNYSKPE